MTTFPLRDSIRPRMSILPNPPSSRSGYERAKIRLLGLCVAGLGLVLVVFFGAGRWLVVEDSLEKATSIAVLSGSMPLRALEAANLYRQGYAPEVWLTHSSEPAEALKHLDIPYIGEEFYSSRILVHEGVPAEATYILEPAIENTADELRVISSALAKEKGGGAVILVTTKAHTRRVRLLWQKLSPKNQRAIVRASSLDPFDPGHWWRTTTDALEVVREILGLLHAWAGSPLPHAK